MTKKNIKKQWKLVQPQDVIDYKCGVKPGDCIRLKKDIVVRDYQGRPTGLVHKAQEVWSVLLGTRDEPSIVFIRMASGELCTWSDDESFLEIFEKIDNDGDNDSTDASEKPFK